MLTDRQNKAVAMLFELTDDEIARTLRIKRETLEAWKQEPAFVQAVCDRIRENRRTAVRILSQLYVKACRELAALIEDDKNKPKVIVEILKASGIFKELGLDEGDYIGNLLERLSEGDQEAESEDED